MVHVVCHKFMAHGVDAEKSIAILMNVNHLNATCATLFSKELQRAHGVLQHPILVYHPKEPRWTALDHHHHHHLMVFGSCNASALGIGQNKPPRAASHIAIILVAFPCTSTTAILF